MFKVNPTEKLLALGAFAVALLFAGSASAASISNPLFSNGQTTIDATGGSTVSGTFTLTVGVGEVVEWLRTQSDASQPFVDTSVGGQLGYQEQVYTNVPFSTKVPPNTGTFWPTVQGAGIFGGGRAINGGDNVVLGATPLGTVRVVANGAGTGTVSGAPVTFESLYQMLMDAQGQLTCVTTGGMWNAVTKVCGAKPAAPTDTAVCSVLESYEGFEYGDKGSAVKKAQKYVMNHGGSIAAGATGFWGNQSANALEDALDDNNCQ